MVLNTCDVMQKAEIIKCQQFAEIDRAAICVGGRQIHFKGEFIAGSAPGLMKAYRTRYAFTDQFGGNGIPGEFDGLHAATLCQRWEAS